MITFEISPLNRETLDIALLNTISTAISEQILKKNFLAAFVSGHSSSVSASKITIQFEGVTIAPGSDDSLRTYLFNLFNEILVKANVRDVVFVSSLGIGVYNNDQIFHVPFRSETRNQTLLGNLLSDEEIPAEFKCVLSNQIMDVPVKLKNDATNKCYNKAHIRHHLFTKQTNAQVDPFSRAPVKIQQDIVKDDALKQRIDAFVKTKLAEKAAERQRDLATVMQKFAGARVSRDMLQATLREFAAKNDLKSAEVLIDHFNLDVNLQDQTLNSGKTALHHAVANKHPEMVRLLISKGARIDARDAFGKTPSIYAVESGDPTLIGAVMGNIDLSKLAPAAKTMK